MEGDGEGLGHRCRVVLACVGNGVADRRRRRHVLGEAAVDLEAERAVLGAQVRSMAEAPPTATARDSRARDDPVADAQSRDVIAESDDPPDELVSEDDARSAENGPVVPFRGVRATDRGTGHLEHDLSGRRRDRVGDVLDADVVRPVEDGRPHAISTRSGP